MKLTFLKKNLTLLLTAIDIQLFQLRLSLSKAEKSNTSAKDCWESLKYSLIFSDSHEQAFHARIRLFRFARGQP
jgi:hypothetical protein